MPAPFERIYAVSNTHGPLAPFQAALDLVGVKGDSMAKLMLLGDYIDRSAESCYMFEEVRRAAAASGSRHGSTRRSR